MTDISDCESDAGASPSVSSDESGNSSSSGSSTHNLKIVTNTPLQSTPKKKATSNTTPITGGGVGLNNSVTPGSSSSFLSISASTSGLCSTPVSSERRPVRRRQLCATPTTPVSSNNSSVVNTSAVSSTPGGPKAGTSKGTPQSNVSSKPASSTTPVLRKRKRPSSKVLSSPDQSDHDQHGEGEDSKSASAQKRKRNKRRRTRSERNFRAGKAPVVVPGPTPVVAEGEEAVALDAEIDRVLEEKAIKNNLSATNVKSIIRHVITNNMVQKMIMSAMRKKAEVADAGGSSDEDGLMEPKMTRAKTKELLENKQISLWPIVDSPVKKSKKPVSETHILIHNDLPEDSSGDEEYVPKETDISEIAHSDDDSSNISHTSDAGSPYKHGFMTRLSVQAEKSPLNDNLFKTPPPRPKNLRKTQVDSAISLRTRSKLPLNDTQLEDLERQLVAPDITPDMYDWGTQSDNEDYLAFLKDFLNPAQNQNDANDDDDPEYNVMEDDEDLHDKEELRRDRAVKVPKKELTQLIAELFENGGILSGDDMDDDLETLTGITPLINDSGYTDGRLGDTSMNTTAGVQNNTSILSVTSVDSSLNVTNPPASTAMNAGIGMPSLQTPQKTGQEVAAAANVTQVVNQSNDNLEAGSSSQVTADKAKAEETLATVAVEDITVSTVVTVTTEPEPATAENVIEVPEFQDCDLKLLQHQLRQHLQLLTQSYVLTVTSEDPCLKRIAKSAKMMVVEVKNFSRMNGPQSNFSVCNMDSAWNIVNFWPHKFIQQSPIKKKILEEKYISESCVINDAALGLKGALFPRHVVKVIAENQAFLYNELLPERYNQKNMERRCTFTYSEDALLVGALEELKDRKMTVNQMAAMIAKVLLVVHHPGQLFHRIRNLKKPAFQRHPSIKAYFQEGILPIPDRTVPELTDEEMLPLLQRDRRGLSHLWSLLMQHIEDYSTSTYKWEQELRRDPAAKSIYKKNYNSRYKRKRKRPINQQNEDSATPVPGTTSETVNRVFTKGALVVDQTDPNTKSIPILDAMGQVGAIIHVPRLCLVTASPEKKVPEVKAYHPKEEFKRRAQQQQQPLEAQEAGVEPDNLPQSASSSNTYLNGLNYLLQQSLKTPVKKNKVPAKRSVRKNETTPKSKTKRNDIESEKIPENQTKTNDLEIEKTPESKKSKAVINIESPSPFKIPQVPPSASKQVTSFSVIHVVGKPFDLPELGIGSNQVYELSALQTPLKKKIFEKVAEQELSSNNEESRRSVELSPARSDVCDDSSIPPDSPNVIMEGTEVELTSDEYYEDDEDGVDLRCHESPEMISLSSDDEVIEAPKEKPKDGGGGSGGSGSSNENKSGNSPPKKTESCSNKPGTSTSSQSTVVNTTSRKGLSRSNGKDDSDDDDKDKKPNNNARKRNLPKDYMGEDESAAEKEKPSCSQSNKRQSSTPVAVPSTSPQIMQAPPVPGTSSQSQQQSKTLISTAANRPQKKARKSPGNQASKSRVSKYNVTQPENMLQGSSTDFDDTSDAYMEAYLGRVQAATEANHPGVYAAFVQMLIEAGDTTINQQELYGKVKALFKDYPDLLKEFESMLDPSLVTSNESSTSVAVVSSHDQVLAEIDFIQMVEKYTVNCPALKAKIMNKLKSLKETANFSEKELATAMEPFFSGNPVMMEAFKALLPSVYRPQSLSSGMDFEVIELDMDDPPRENSDEMQFEVVKLPDETQVPATSTCPCVCHVKTSSPAFANRSKHCRKCSLKFQDGKIYIHNGRVMRPVSVELTPAPTKHMPSTSSAAATSRSRKDSSHHHGHPAPTHPPNQHQSGKPKEFKEPDVTNRPSEKKTHGHGPSSLPQSSTQPLVQASSSGVKVRKDESEVDGGGGGSGVTHHQKHEGGKAETSIDNTPKKSHHKNQSPPKQDKEPVEWTEEEDMAIFTICQQEPSLQVAWKKIAAQIPHRTLDQLKGRFSELIELIKLENKL